MIEIATYRSCFAALNQRLGSATIERRDGVRAIPCQGKRFAARPIINSVKYFQHFAKPRLSSLSPAPITLPKRCRSQSRRLGQLVDAHGQSGRQFRSVD